jgi:hypothetical protein
MEPISVGTAVCVGEVIDKAREEGKIVEATTTGTFMMPDGDKSYNTFLEMLRDQPMPPDPVFKDEDVLPTIEDAGFPLDQMDAYDADFKKMYEDMFSRTSEMGVMGAGDFEARLATLQNELSNTKVENPNGGGIDLISSGGSSVHASQRPATPFCADVPVFGAGAFVSIPEAGSYAGGAKVDDERSGTPVDA